MLSWSFHGKTLFRIRYTMPHRSFPTFEHPNAMNRMQGRDQQAIKKAESSTPEICKQSPGIPGTPVYQDTKLR
jgi:hypothetical protein